MYSDALSLYYIADQLQVAGKVAIEKDDLEAQLEKSNALQPAKIDNGWSTNSKVIEKMLPCYRAAHFGKRDKGDSRRFSHREIYLMDLVPLGLQVVLFNSNLSSYLQLISDVM